MELCSEYNKIINRSSYTRGRLSLPDTTEYGMRINNKTMYNTDISHVVLGGPDSAFHRMMLEQIDRMVDLDPIIVDRSYNANDND